jgi:hypothetical protein
MIDHVWTVVCSRAVIDRSSNNVSLQTVLEQLIIEDTPDPDGGLLIELDVMTLWARRDFDIPARGHGRLIFLSPSGEGKIGPLEYDIDLSEYKRARRGTHVRGLPIGEPGRYTFRVDYKNLDGTRWRRVAAIPLEVIFEPPKKSEQASDESE